MDIETQIGENEGPGRRMKQNDLVEPEAPNERALELVGSLNRRVIRERSLRIAGRSPR